MKLYKVTLKGMLCNPTGKIHGINYVIADSLDNAYKIVRDFLDKEDLGFEQERELDKIEVIAEEDFYGDSPYKLFLNKH